jgi:hypothetical protein
MLTFSFQVKQYLWKASSCACKSLSDSDNITVSSAYSIINNWKHNLSIKCLLSLFDKMVKPILLYGCEIWGFGNNDVLEKVHSHSMLLKVCVCHILEKPVSLNIFPKIFIHLISKFCCKYKWCDNLYIMHDILDCFPQIILGQKRQSIISLKYLIIEFSKLILNLKNILIF